MRWSKVISTIFAKSQPLNSKDILELREITRNPGKLLKQKMPFSEVVKSYFNPFAKIDTKSPKRPRKSKKSRESGKNPEIRVTS